MNSDEKKPSTLIFDMDGVLIDSEPLHKQAKERAFAEHGIVLPESVYDSYKGRPDLTMMTEVLTPRGWSRERVEQFSRRKRQIYEEIEHRLRVMPGAEEFLRWAAPHFRIALATSSTPRNREAAFRLLGLRELFQVVVDSSQHSRPKPDPEVFLVAMRNLGVQPAECWVIEDSVNGVNAAKAAGAVVAAITTTFGRDTLAAAGADLIVRSFAELRKRLE